MIFKQYNLFKTKLLEEKKKDSKNVPRFLTPLTTSKARSWWISFPIPSILQLYIETVTERRRSWQRGHKRIAKAFDTWGQARNVSILIFASHFGNYLKKSLCFAPCFRLLNERPSWNVTFWTEAISNMSLLVWNVEEKALIFSTLGSHNWF